MGNVVEPKVPFKCSNPPDVFRPLQKGRRKEGRKEGRKEKERKEKKRKEKKISTIVKAVRSRGESHPYAISEDSVGWLFRRCYRVCVSVGVSGISVSRCDGGGVRMAKRFKEGATEDNGPNTTTVAVAVVISSRIMGYAGEVITMIPSWRITFSRVFNNVRDNNMPVTMTTTTTTTTTTTMTTCSRTTKRR
ncbi:hypothetical protein V1478_009392 [Vespula squamosa]|uniref:Uncharacterized protein n=1 Tax=Vespula squamosa TaxID=30214 RepID=A0ABD2APJ4_VESSQ